MRKLSRHFVFTSLLWIAVLISTGALTTPGRKLELPFGPIKRLASPDGSRVLYGAGTSSSGRPTELWLEDSRSGQRQKILDVARTLSAGWSPDGSFFFVQDDLGSNITEAYLYEAANLKRLDIAQSISAFDPAAKRFAAGHAYFNVRRWLDGQHLLIVLSGHTDSPPVECFDLRYRVGRDCTVAKLSQLVASIDDPACN